MKIAAGVNGQRLITGQMEHGIRRFAGLKVPALAAVLGDKLGPLDVVLVLHRMLHAASVYGDDLVLYGHHRDVLFAAGLNGVGDQLGHLLAAAYGIYAGVIDISMRLPQVGQI